MGRYRVPDHVFHRVVHDEVVVLNAKNNEYLGLNASAAIVWQALADDGNIEAAVQRLTEAFVVTPEAAASDVADLVSDLLERELIEPVR